MSGLVDLLLAEGAGGVGTVNPSTTFEDEFTATRALLAGWTTTRLAWPNQQFTKPKPTDDLAYVNVSVLSVDARHSGILGNGGVARFQGEVVLELYAPLQSKSWGQGDIARVIDELVARFLGATSTGLRFRVPILDPVGEDEGWYHVNLRCPFVRDAAF